MLVFGSEEYNDLPLIRGNPPSKKVRWARMVEQTSKSVNLLLFADDTTSLCRRSNMQDRKEMLKQTFKDWKLILNDDKWEHIIAESDPEERKQQRKNMDKTARILGAHRNALGTFHHDQKKRLMAARKVWFKLSKKKNFLYGPFRKIWKVRLRQLLWAPRSSLDVKYVASAARRKENTKPCGLEWCLGSRDKSGEIWNKTKKTLADLRIACKMKPILDLIRMRQLNYLASLARLPDDRLEKIVLRGHLIPEHAVGVSKAAPKNTVRKKQLLSIAHLAPEELRLTWLKDLEKIAVEEASWKKFMKKVCKWQDAQEEKRRYSNIHDHNVRSKEVIMTRKAAVDALRLEFSGVKAKCPLCQMEYRRSGLAVHFARCSQMNEEERRIKTAARICEVGRRKTDLPVELNETRRQVKHASQESHEEKRRKFLMLQSSRRSWLIWLKGRKLNK